MHISNLSADYPDLHDACHKYPSIDNHAHALLKLEHRDAMIFENVISDASGAALQDSVHSLACFRATIQLAKLFGLKGEDVTWEKVKAAGRAMEYEKLCRTCFEPARIQFILIDDGLGGSKDLVEDYKWHDGLTTSPTKRIVRLEVAAEVFLHPLADLTIPICISQDILKDILKMKHAYQLDHSIPKILELFDLKFRALIHTSEDDTEVVGYKSIAAYRTGLKISVSGSKKDIETSLGVAVKSYYDNDGRELRLQHKAFNDHVVRMALNTARKPG